MAANADAQVDIAPGFRFQPTDQELVNCYLRPKVLQEQKLQLNFIPEVDLYKCEPWELPDKAFPSSSGADGSKVEWYLFAPRDRKYGPKSVRMNRATPLGFWKSTGKDRSVKHHHMDAVIGKKKTLVYHHGRAPNGEHTDWVMREYRLHRDGMAALQDTYVLCRLYKKNATTEGAPMQSMPNVTAADTEGPSTQFAPSGAASDEEQFNIDDFFTDEDMNQVNVDNFLAGEDMNQFNFDNLFTDEDMNQFNFDNLFADEGMNQFNFDNLFTDEDMEQFNLDNLFAP